MIDYGEMEAKWQKAWEEARLFESEPSEKQPFMAFAAFPYVNTPQHIGHLRTYGTADLLARYKRMRGFNVLFPMGFHATGTPVLAFAKRLANNDSELIEELRLFHVADDDIKKMTDPVYIASYFIKKNEVGMRAVGYSVDWRREFISTDAAFSKFVEWQFGILHELGFLTQGAHPVGWCPNENNAVGMHDTKHDMEPEIEEQTAIRFKVEGEDASVLCATYRPETIFGVTNIFVDEKAKYSLCKIAGKEGNLYLARASADVLKHQMNIEVLNETDGAKMLKKKCINPVTKEVVPVLPGFFVKEDVGTGIVMSVPSHAPFDYAALHRLKARGYQMPEIKPKKIIEVQIGRSLGDVSAGEAKPVHIDVPALAYLEVLHADENAIDDMLEFATKLEYREESHWGKMTVPGYEGMSEPEARDKIRSEMLKHGNAIPIYSLTNAPIYCRCGTKVVVKVVSDQWFINYGDAKWKEKVREALKMMSILPGKSRNAFESAAEWINLRAVARSQGLGTRFPLDRRFLIESLSDSTIYPAFYTIVHLIRDVKPELLVPKFFDYVFLGKGDLEDVSKSTGIDYRLIKLCKESFDYWYVMTSNHSSPDLIFNHYTMYIFNHVAIFEKKYWPKQIVTNGIVLYEGEKMSKSLGNVIPLEDGIAKYGGDPLRVLEIAGTDLFTDSEFSADAAEGVRSRLQYLYDTAERSGSLEAEELRRIDYWLYSKLNRKIAAATEAMEKLELRDASVAILYNSIVELKRYFARGGKNAIVVKEYLSAVALMLQPIAPHFSEELWHQLGNTTFSSVERWPEANGGMVSDAIEAGEDLVGKVVEDAKQIMALMQRKSGKKAREIRIIVADDWKRALANELAKKKSIEKVLEEARKDKAINKEAAAKYLGALAKRVNEIREVTVMQEDEFSGLSDASEYIGAQLGCTAVVEKESESKSRRAERAMPLKPSLDISF